MTPKNPESFMKVSRTVSEIFGILLSNPVAYLKKETTRTESIKILLHNPYGAAVVTLLQDLREDKYCALTLTLTLLSPDPHGDLLEKKTISHRPMPGELTPALCAAL